jgi:transcription elongation factor SPT6
MADFIDQQAELGDEASDEEVENYARERRRNLNDSSDDEEESDEEARRVVADGFIDDEDDDADDRRRKHKKRRRKEREEEEELDADDLDVIYGDGVADADAGQVGIQSHDIRVKL